RRRDGDEQGPELEVPRRGEDACGDEERVAREEETDHEARLREDDHHQHEEAAPADDPLDVVKLVREVLKQSDHGREAASWPRWPWVPRPRAERRYWRRGSVSSTPPCWSRGR